MKKQAKNFIFALLIFLLMFLVFTPYFTSDFIDLRQQAENAERKEAKQKAEEKAQKIIYLTGKFDPTQRTDFVLMPSQYTLLNVNQSKMYLRKETYDAFLQMRISAEKDSIDLKIASATRNFDYQKILWNNKWNGVTLVNGKNLSKSIPNGQKRFEKILEYSAVPGASRHHWGTDIDINGASPEYFEKEKGEGEYAWLVANASSFGFCQTYNEKNVVDGYGRQTGYNEEKWHWSYLPLARDFTKEYENLVKEEDIKGFMGDEYVLKLNLIQNYVLSINPECL